MRYNPITTQQILAAVTHGSHLYGTNTPASDYDFKVVTLPALNDLLLAKRLDVKKYKFDADGNPVPEDMTMPADGYEAEHTPLQKFVADYLSGQAYAVEFVFAFKQGFAKNNAHHDYNYHVLRDFLETLPVHRNVDGMVGFAMKQTFDYVRRGERYNSALATLAAIESVQAVLCTGAVRDVRLDHPFMDNKVLDYIASRCDLQTGETINHDKVIRTLKLNGREYLETTMLDHLKTAVIKLRDQYGTRATDAAMTNVEWKSLAHAVRVYQQVVELLRTGFITFPRQNADVLLAIRRAQIPLEVVKELLRELDDEVQQLVAESTFPEVDEELKEQVQHNLLRAIHVMHGLNPVVD